MMKSHDRQCDSPTYELQFTEDVLKIMAKWKRSNHNLFKKLSKVLADIQSHPRTGIAHPEPMVDGGGSRFSRRITAHDRIIYDIYDDTVVVLVVDLEGHYNDK